MTRLDTSFLEKIITKTMLRDKRFLVLVSHAYEKDYFDDSGAGKIFEFARNHLDEYKSVPTKEMILNTVPDGDVKEMIEEAESLDFDIADNYQYIIDQTNKHLKDQAIKRAFVECVDIVTNGENVEEVREKIEDALCKDLKINLGLSYFADMAPRLRKIFEAADVNRVKTYFPEFDDILNGGFPPFTLSVLVARIHGFKSNTMANFAARQVINGKNVLMLTLEMSEEMFAQRFDSIYSLLDINRMYYGDQKRELMRKLVNIKNTEGRGDLWIKQFPTGAATVRDFRVYIRELLMRDFEPNIVYVDYINLMKAAVGKYKDLYSSVKTIAEELRALSFEFEIPFVSVSQLNREGSFVGYEELDFFYIAESMGLPATCDFMSIIGTDEDQLVYQSELHNKIVKNRLGGRVGEIWKCYYDSRSLKMYDETEMDMWIADAQFTGDERTTYTPQPQSRGRRRGNTR